MSIHTLPTGRGRVYCTALVIGFIMYLVYILLPLKQAGIEEEKLAQITKMSEDGRFLILMTLFICCADFLFRLKQQRKSPSRQIFERLGESTFYEIEIFPVLLFDLFLIIVPAAIAMTLSGTSDAFNCGIAALLNFAAVVMILNNESTRRRFLWGAGFMWASWLILLLYTGGTNLNLATICGSLFGFLVVIALVILERISLSTLKLLKKGATPDNVPFEDD